MAVTSRHFLRPRSSRRALDARGRGAGVAYDGDERPTGRRYPDGTRVTLAFDAVGNRALAQDSLGRYTTTYDSLNRARTTTTPANKTITYAYDSGSQRRHMIDPDGGRFTYAFDAVGRNSLVVNPQSERTTWTFDAIGRTTVQKLANGCRASYAYDSGNRLVRLANLKSDGTTISSFRDSWDNSGNRTSRVEADGVRVTWSYDATYQLTREQRSGGNAYDIQYAYDSASNRRTKLENSITTSYTYDGANQLLTLKDNTGTTSFTFDNSGNQRVELTPGGARTTNTWDYENRLTKVQLSSGVVNSFGYDPDGLRVKRQNTSGTRKIVWDGPRALVETDSSDVTQVAFCNSDVAYGDLISQRQSGATSFYLFDPLDSTDRLTNSSQAVTDSYIYQASGTLVASSGSTPNSHRYVGRLGYQFDSDIAKLYIRARFYDPIVGRWLSPDPLPSSTAGGFYLYVDGRFVVATDPSGLLPSLAEICGVVPADKNKVCSKKTLKSKRTERRCCLAESVENCNLNDEPREFVVTMGGKVTIKGIFELNCTANTKKTITVAAYRKYECVCTEKKTTTRTPIWKTVFRRNGTAYQILVGWTTTVTFSYRWDKCKPTQNNWQSHVYDPDCVGQPCDKAAKGGGNTQAPPNTGARITEM